VSDGRKRLDYLLRLIGDGRVDLRRCSPRHAMSDVVRGYDMFRSHADG